MPSYKLHYFEGRGAGESTRQILSLAGQKFEDKRYSDEAWEDHKHEMPFNQLPVLEVDGEKIAQSGAILRFLSKRYGFAGKGEFEEARVDGMYDQFKDFINEVRPFTNVLNGYTEGDLEKERKEVLIPNRDKYFAIFARYIDKNPSGFLIGSSVTFPDVVLAEFTAMTSIKAPELFDGFPQIRSHMEKVRSIPNLKSWLDRRPVSDW